MNAKKLFHEVTRRIDLKERQDDVPAIASMLLENIFGLTMNDILRDTPVAVNAEASRLLDAYVQRINRHEPVQYVLGQAAFFGRMFQVTPAVLIPRPETEELVRAVLDRRPTKNNPSGTSQVLDIGTGSGCIAITLSLAWQDAHVFATDISVDALAIARQNSDVHRARVDFVEHDILREDIPWRNLQAIVSNPPYIAASEQSSMDRNVLEFEPHAALFAPDDDPLIFYRHIASKAKTALARGGILAVEINERYGEEVCQLLTDNGWKDVTLLADIDGKARVITATL